MLYLSHLKRYRFTCIHVYVMKPNFQLCRFTRTEKTVNRLPLCNVWTNVLFQKYFFSKVRHANEQIVELKTSQRGRNTLFHDIANLFSCSSADPRKENTHGFRVTNVSSMNYSFWSLQFHFVHNNVELLWIYPYFHQHTEVKGINNI